MLNHSRDIMSKTVKDSKESKLLRRQQEERNNFAVRKKKMEPFSKKMRIK